MSEVIRISAPTYKRLESLARGFDTPGNVIDRLLDFYDQHGKKVSLRPKSGIKGSKLRPGLKTPEKAYYRPILKALVDMGGKASVREALVRVENVMKGLLNERDRQPISSKPNELRWANTAKWARKHMTMMKPPLLKPGSPKNTWEITEAGRKFLETDRSREGF